MALEQGPKRLHEDHANARLLAEGVAEIPGVAMDLATVETNIVIFDVSGTGKASAEIVAELGERGVRCGSVGPKMIRFVTHLDASREQCEGTVEILRAICNPAARA
jgi:threonine aldolase